MGLLSGLGGLGGGGGQDEIKVDYPLMQEMKATFAHGREQLSDTSTELKSIAEKLEGGALLGDAGQALTEAIRGSLLAAVQTLSSKFEELEGDIQSAVDLMRAAEQQAKGTFSN